MSPWASKTTPEPKPLSVVISTPDGRTFLTTLTKSCCRETALPDGARVVALEIEVAWLGARVAAGPELLHPARAMAATAAVSRTTKPVKRSCALMARSAAAVPRANLGAHARVRHRPGGRSPAPRP